MAEKIKITPEELKSQAVEMKNLESDFSILFSGVTSDLKKVNTNWSPNLSHNFEGKINSAQNSFTQITQELMNGAKVADTCAVTFQSVDSELSKLYCADGNEKTNIQTVAEVMEWLDGEWIDEQLAGLPLWMRESIKEALSDASKEFFGKTINESYDITQKILEGDYLGALKDATEALYGAYNESKKIDLNFFEKLGPKFYINSVFGMVEEYIEYAKDPSLQNLLSIGWSGTVGSVFETVGDAAWDVVKYIPGVSDWYEEHGANDMGGAFNVMYTEAVRFIWGDDMADYCGSYYADNGGLFDGLVNGFKEIKQAVDDSCERHGGIMGVWLNGWNSMFS